MGKLNEKFLLRNENLLKKAATPPQITSNMYRNVSEERRALLDNEVERGLFRDGSSNIQPKHELTSASYIASSVGIKKNADLITSQSAGTGWRGGNGEAMRQTPEVYSPLWLNSNLNLPRDRATINAWCRSFYALQPFVQNAINLHSTYPISKLNIKCPNKKVERFFNDMIEEIDLMNICSQVAQEFWLLGESFIYAELDERAAKWSRLVIQNPDYIVVKRSVIASEPLIMMRPDENLRRIVFSNKPSDIEQKRQLNETIVEHIKRGENIPLDNFYISHLARRISPYEVRGTGLPVCCFRQIMLFDQLRECYDANHTEVLTNLGFKKLEDITTTTTDSNAKGINGAVINNDNADFSLIALKPGIKVACFNSNNNEIEYHEPEDLSMSYYEGDMYHFKSKTTDIMVSPNHKMWAQKKNRLNGKSGWNDWEKVAAKDVNPNTTYRFRAFADWKGNKINSVKVLDKDVPIELYLKFLGYLISEGCLTSKNTINFAQSTNSDIFADFKQTISDFASIFGKEVKERIIQYENFASAALFKTMPANGWQGNIYNTKLNEYFRDIISTDEQCTSCFKQVPQFIKELSPDLLKIFLNALVYGDGSHIKNKNSNAFKYYTISKKLADDVQEIVLKCGYSSYLRHRKIRSGATEYIVSWSDASYGKFPHMLPNNKYPAKINKVDYKGVVWCLQVPTGLLITRRNGHITIQGNSKFAQASNMINPLTLIKIGSADYKPTLADIEAWRNEFSNAQYDKDFKIFTHDAVSVERVGYGQGIYDISGDITQLLKEIYTGLMVPQVIMDGGGDISYANGGISLDVLRQRYMQFRNMISAWLRKKIFAPISKLNEFYDLEDGEKKLIIPEVDWNHMSLFDTTDYVNVLVQLSGEQKKVSQQTLYRSLGLEYEEERRKIKKEDIKEAIRKKEMLSLERMALNELRALSEEDEIPEILEPILQSESPYSQGTSPGGDQGMGGLPPLPGASPPPDLGLPPPAPISAPPPPKP